MKIYVYTEQCLKAGKVCDDQNLIERCERGETADIDLYMDGTIEEIEEEARRIKAARWASNYQAKCAQNVLNYLFGEAK